MKFCPFEELDARVAALLRVDAGNYTTPQEFFERNYQFLCFDPPKEYSPVLNEDTLIYHLGIIVNHFGTVSSAQWEEEHLKRAYEELIDDFSHAWGDYLDKPIDRSKACKNSVQHFLRLTLMGGRPGPVLMLTMELLGREESLRRMKSGAIWFQEEAEKENNLRRRQFLAGL